jgi:hypothetical protein
MQSSHLLLFSGQCVSAAERARSVASRAKEAMLLAALRALRCASGHIVGRTRVRLPGHVTRLIAEARGHTSDVFRALGDVAVVFLLRVASADGHDDRYERTGGPRLRAAAAGASRSNTPRHRPSPRTRTPIDMIGARCAVEFFFSARRDFGEFANLHVRFVCALKGALCMEPDFAVAAARGDRRVPDRLRAGTDSPKKH